MVDQGPSWVGIGAQRSGTTWFTRLAVSHPAVTLARGGRKELHYFDRFLVDEFTEDDAAEYRTLFAPGGGGEFTPAYLRAPWVPDLLARSCPTVPLVVVLLRDPVDRLESAIRWNWRRQERDLHTWRDRTVAAVQWWESAVTGSAYGTQLAQWRAQVGSENMLLLQYEQVRRDPEAALGRFWRRLGFGPVPVRGVQRPSPTSTQSEWTLPDAWGPWLLGHLGPDVDRALAEWPLDAELWPRWGELVRRHG